MSSLDTTTLYGRTSERSVIELLLDGVRAGTSGVLVLRGEAGIGKTALLRDAARMADGIRLLRASGVESESEIAFGGLHQLVRPLLDVLVEVPEVQRTALEVALGIRSAGTPDRFLIGAGLLSLLAAAAESQPLLVLVDDAHWLDRPSADALTFAARRLEAEPIAILAAARSGEPRSFDTPGLAGIELAGLDHGSAELLLARGAPEGLSDAVRGRLLGASAGNPLALLELPRALTAEQRLGREPLPDPLPAGNSLEAVFAERACRLPKDAQRVLLLAAADGGGEASVLHAAAALVGIGADAIDAAEASELLRIDGDRVEFRHPLVRSVVYRGASFSERQQAHKTLASALTGEAYADRRAWHRAGAVAGQNEEVAAELERTAERARARGGYAAAAAALERAADLTVDTGRRAHRLVAAAGATWLGGQSERTGVLLDQASSLTADPAIRANVDHLLAMIELQRGAPSQAYSILMRSEAEIAVEDPGKAAEMLASANQAAAFGGDLASQIEIGRRADALADRLNEPRFELALLAGVAKMLEGRVTEGASRLREAIALAESSTNPSRFLYAGAAALYLAEPFSSWRQYSRAVALARQEGSISLLAQALAMLAFGEILCGHFSAARANAEEGLRLARETGQDNCTSHHLALLAVVAAVAGNECECRKLASEAFAIATPHALGMQATTARWALGILELGLGRPAAALTHLSTLTAAGAGSGNSFLGQMATPDLVEAAVRAGAKLDLNTTLRPFTELVVSTDSAWARPAVARCRGLLARGEQAKREFAAALDLHAAAGSAFDCARTELVFGQTLRRARQPRDARRHLRSALETFDELGARSWAERARLELRASGETARRRDPSTRDQLTPQELQIARFVAQGAPNKEVAARLFLSPRTIDFHLRKVFVKLGISSRAELSAIDLGVDHDPT